LRKSFYDTFSAQVFLLPKSAANAVDSEEVESNKGKVLVS
jgi:hypothetical protein